jgi:hypothetical protein
LTSEGSFSVIFKSQHEQMVLAWFGLVYVFCVSVQFYEAMMQGMLALARRFDLVTLEE